MMLWVSGSLSVAIALLFGWSSIKKMANPHEITTSLSQLRIRLPFIGFSVLVVAEMGTAVSAVLPLPGIVPAVGVAGLGCAFAIAAIISLRSRDEIRCACFGTTKHLLGTRQLYQFPAFLCVALLFVLLPRTWGLSTSLAILLVGLFGTLVLTVARGVRAATLAAADRRALTGVSEELF